MVLQTEAAHIENHRSRSTPPRRGRFDAPSFVAGVVANILVAAFTLALLSAIDGVIA